MLTDEQLLLQHRLRFDTPFWAGGVTKDAQGRWEYPAPGAFQGCAKILDKSRLIVPAIAKPWQLELDDILEKQRAEGKPMRVIILKARKLGFSTWIALKFLQRVTQLLNQAAVVVAQDTDTAGTILDMGKRAWSHLPDEHELPVGFSIKPQMIHEGSTKNGRKHMIFGEKAKIARRHGAVDDSIFEVDTAGSPAAGRGTTPNLLHLSEIAFWESTQARNKMLAMLEAVPYEPETIVAMESTANGLNHFYKRWVSAKEGNADPDRSGEVYAPLFVPWWRDQNCSIRFGSDEGRERFVNSIGNTAEMGEVAEDEPMLVELYGCTPEQLQWRRMKIQEQPDRAVQTFNQENPHCLTFETRVSTELGMLRIGEARDAALTESGPVRHWFPQRSAPIWRLTTKQGRVLRGTAEHPVQTNDGLTLLPDLRRGAKLMLRPPRFAERKYVERWDGPLGLKHEMPVDARLGRFLGYFMGDGSWYRGTLAFSLDAKDEDVIADVTTLTTELARKPQRRIIARVQGRKGMVELRVSARGAEPLLKRLGCVAPSPSGVSLRREVCVPEAIWRSPRSVVREFLRALFECDGSASQGCVRWGSSKLQFARDVQLLLLGFGLNATMSASTKPSGNGTPYEFYALQLGGDAARAFHDDIGFIGERKRAARPEPGLSGLGRPCRGLQMWDEVVSVEPDGEEVTYDFTMDTEDHLFMANGILTHNSDEAAFIGTGHTVFSGVLISRGIKAAEAASTPVTGTLRVPDAAWKERNTKSGTKRIPQSALWVPREQAKHGEHLLDVWEPPRHAAEVPLTIAENGVERPATDFERRDGAYVLFADVGGGEAGTLTAGDYHAVKVFDHHTRQEVAMHNSRMPLEDLPLWLLLIALYYNEARLAVEVNNMGIYVVQALHKEYRYRRMYRREQVGVVEDQESNRAGWETNQSTKPAMEGNYMEALASDLCGGLRDPQTARQMQTYVVNDKGKHEAQPGEYDDRIMAAMGGQMVLSLRRPPRIGGEKRRGRYEPADAKTGY